MKTVQIVLRSAMAVCFAAIMSSASCDLLDKVDDVTFEIELSDEFKVNETATATNKAYSLKETLDATSNSDFAKYKDKIKSITITSVQYEVSEYTTAKSVIFKNGSIGFSSSAGSAPTSVASLNAEDLKAIVGQEKNLTYNQAAIDDISNLLRNDKQVGIFLTGTFSETPVAFKLEVKIKASITANAL